MIYKLLSLYDKFNLLSAHLHIVIMPCKIYDPIISQLAVLTMIRLVDLIEDINKKESLSSNDYAQKSQLIAQKPGTWA